MLSLVLFVLFALFGSHEVPTTVADGTETVGKAFWTSFTTWFAVRLLVS